MQTNLFDVTLPIRITRRPDAEAQVNLRKRRAWFDDAGGGEGSSGGGQGEKPSQQDTGTSSGQTGGNNAGEGEQQRVTMPLSDLNDRVQRAKQAAVNDLLKDLGVESADALKAALKRLAEVEEADKTELQKAQGAVEKLKGDLKKAQDELTSERERHRIERRDNAILAKASELGAKKPRAALVLAQSDYPEMLARTLNEDGTVNMKAVDELLTAIQKENRELFSVNPGSPSNSGGKVGLNDKEIRSQARRQTSRMLRG